MNVGLSPLMQRQVDRAREAGLAVKVDSNPTGCTVLIREGGPVPGWLLVKVVPSGSRFAHYASKALMPDSRPHDILVRDIGMTVSNYIEGQKRRTAIEEK